MQMVLLSVFFFFVKMLIIQIILQLHPPGDCVCVCVCVSMGQQCIRCHQNGYSAT